MNLIDKMDRGSLAEGRNSGIGFALCKREGDDFRCVMPITCCKDFLNDQVYSEHTGKPYSIYGMKSVKEGCFDSGVAYMALGILPVNKTIQKHPNHDELEKALMAPETGLKSLLSQFSLAFGIRSTDFDQIAPNRMLATLGLEWVESTYMVSLWSLLVRVGLKYKGGDPIKFLESVSDDDAYIVKGALPKIKWLMKNFPSRPKQDFKFLSAPHHIGIVGFALPQATNNL